MFDFFDIIILGDSVKKYIIFLLIIFIIPINIFSINIKSEHAILYNLNDNQILYEVKANERVQIASMTKIMTAIVALEKIKDIDSKVIMTNDMFYRLIEENASVAGFKVGEEVTYEDLLYGLMLPSGADAAQALAISTYGSIDNFVDAMNKKAKDLNLKNTKFSNPAGFDSTDNYSSVFDVSIILKYSLKNYNFKEVFTADKYTTSNKQHTFLSTRVKSNFDSSFLDGSKTGFTYDAGLCLASIAHHNNVNYLLVTAKAPYNNRLNHLIDAKEIYSYYFNNYDEITILNRDDKIVTLNIKDKYTIDYYMNEDIKKYIKKDCTITKEYIGKENIDDVVLNDKVGDYIVKCDGEEIYSKDIYLVIDNTKIKKNNNYFTIVIVVLTISIFLAFITLLFIKLRRRK